MAREMDRACNRKAFKNKKAVKQITDFVQEEV